MTTDSESLISQTPVTDTKEVSSVYPRDMDDPTDLFEKCMICGADTIVNAEYSDDIRVCSDAKCKKDNELMILYVRQNDQTVRSYYRKGLVHNALFTKDEHDDTKWVFRENRIVSMRILIEPIDPKPLFESKDIVLPYFKTKEEIKEFLENYNVLK